jgi:MerR family redox-sensitive transcriptional activator SoxR
VVAISVQDVELTIGAVAERAGIAVSALRFYEAHGLVTSTRTTGGQRRYTRDVLRRLAVIRSAQRVGFSLAEIDGMLAEVPDGHHVTEAEWRALAASWRPAIDERIRVLERLRDQLDRCIGCGCLSMRTCQMANPGDRAGRRGPGPRYWLTGGQA